MGHEQDENLNKSYTWLIFDTNYFLPNSKLIFWDKLIKLTHLPPQGYGVKMDLAYQSLEDGMSQSFNS